MPISNIENTAKITVTSGTELGTARNAKGDMIAALPSITITAKFCGDWENQIDQDEDMKGCIEKLVESYKSYIRRPETL